ncbi:Uu.00g133490.m01.CDS01 [Anthostomella pinea]|uniref:Uu.00g133490.m01.CDS01 n=1 Tax=Anthostomella pinea TaxID=933095 RepID=A0AAI8VNV2_9PEZI|nr:Uu.00g133490.m01.CDS01 [Anthostomella pinea]
MPINLQVRWGRILLLINLCLFSFAVLLNMWALRGWNSFGNKELLQASNSHHRDPLGYYPLLDVATYGPMRFDAELRGKSIFKGPPSELLDNAWSKLVNQPMILVDNEALQSFDPTSKPSKGVDGHYYATVEVYHQLHCLDIIRKFIWRNHYQHVDTFMDPPQMVWEHVDHCIDLLRQVLMCNGDIGLIFYTDVGKEQPIARVSTTHMCRNFSQITEWVNGHDSELGVFAEV